MPIPPDLAGLVDLVVWGIVLFIIIMIAVFLAEYLFKTPRTAYTQTHKQQETDKLLRELLVEIKELRKEINALREELKE